MPHCAQEILRYAQNDSYRCSILVGRGDIPRMGNYGVAAASSSDVPMLIAISGVVVCSIRTAMA